MWQNTDKIEMYIATIGHDLQDPTTIEKDLIVTSEFSFVTFQIHVVTRIPFPVLY